MQKPAFYKKPEKKGAPLAYKTDKSDNMSTVHFLMVLLYFISLFVLIQYYLKTFMNFFELVGFFIFSIALAFLIPISVYRKKYTMSFYEYALINIMGLAPVITALLLLLNFHLASNLSVGTYKIVARKDTGKSVILVLENDAWAEHEFVRTIDDFSNYRKPATSADTLSIAIAEGLFGYKVLKDQIY